MFFFFGFWQKTIRFLGHNFPIGLSKLQSTSPEEPSEESSLPQEVSSVFNQFIKVRKSLSGFGKYKFRNSSKICISRVHRNNLTMNWKKLFLSPSDVWENGSRNLLESFQQFYQHCILLVHGWELLKGQVFSTKKSCLFLLQPWTPSTTTSLSLMKSF